VKSFDGSVAADKLVTPLAKVRSVEILSVSEVADAGDEESTARVQTTAPVVLASPAATPRKDTVALADKEPIHRQAPPATFTINRIDLLRTFRFIVFLAITCC
jgi:hypothetical protein